MDSFATAVSALAGIVTVGTGLVCIARAFRRKLRIEWRVRWYAKRSGGVAFGGYELCVANVSQSNVCVRQIAFELGGDKIVQIFAQHPDGIATADVLIPGQYREFLVSNGTLLAALDHKPRKVFVEASDGRKFYAKTPKDFAE